MFVFSATLYYLLDNNKIVTKKKYRFFMKNLLEGHFYNRKTFLLCIGTKFPFIMKLCFSSSKNMNSAWNSENNESMEGSEI